MNESYLDKSKIDKYNGVVAMFDFLIDKHKVSKLAKIMTEKDENDELETYRLIKLRATSASDRDAYDNFSTSTYDTLSSKMKPKMESIRDSKRRGYILNYVGDNYNLKITNTDSADNTKIDSQLVIELRRK